MKYIVNNIRLSLDGGVEDLKDAAIKKLGISRDQLKGFKIVRESVDARRKPGITLVYSVKVEMEGKAKGHLNGDIRLIEEKIEETLEKGSKKLNSRPLIIGAGPAGLFAGLVLAENGYKPLIIERGEAIENRGRTVGEFWKSRILNPESNVQFGEGGAGTFSDGKLTTRINDRRCEKVLSEFHKSGAGEEILYMAKPHIGTDVLRKVVIDLRERIKSLGGEFMFETKAAGFKISDGKIGGIVLEGGEDIPCQVVILAVGHSARDTFKALLESGVNMVQKPFSIGVRIEHPQELINRAQYGSSYAHPALGAADYQLFHKTGSRTAYSFCMCPGGIVVAAASEPDSIVTNGMSEFARNRENANSALVVSVEPSDFGGSHPLEGIEFQRKWERLAFKTAGSDYSAPVQRLEDFAAGVASKSLGAVKPSYTGPVQPSDINLCLPEFVIGAMKESLSAFDRKLKGFALKDGLLTGVETRTSSPVRITRGDTFEATGIKGLYPAGEGAGYAGGIVSAAVDGIRIAEQIIRTYSMD